jgi:hypothetical protein
LVVTDAPWRKKRRKGMPRKDGDMTQEEEEEYRRKILLRARKGDSKAQDELMDKYRMRVYSDRERAKLPTYYDSGRGSPPSLTSRPAPTSSNQKKTDTKLRPKVAANKRVKTKTKT